MSTIDIVDYLNKLVVEAGSQKNLAAQLGISQVYLSDVLRRKRDPGKKILRKLRIIRTVTYETEPTQPLRRHQQ